MNLTSVVALEFTTHGDMGMPLLFWRLSWKWRILSEAVASSLLNGGDGGVIALSDQGPGTVDGFSGRHEPIAALNSRSHQHLIGIRANKRNRFSSQASDPIE